jgi:TATA-binding protein-associated factor
LKNPKTATAKAARKLHAHYKLILTGTPVQNKVHEVWATFDFLMPNFLGSSSDFTKEFAGPIIKGQANGASATDIAIGMEKLKLLHQQVLPFILRREKEQVLQELPPKIITTIPCEMTSSQVRLYQEFCSSNEGQNSLRAFDQVLHGPATERELPTLGSDVLKALLYLRLLCTHPALVNPKGVVEHALGNLDGSGKLLALKELLRESGMPCQDLSAADNDTSLMYINAEDSDELQKNDIEGVIDPSCDDDALPLDTSLHHTAGGKFLIFTQFTFSLDVIEEFLRRYFPRTRYLRLDGRVPIEKRSQIVDSFNSQENIQILLLTTRIGGLGLNLTGTARANVGIEGILPVSFLMHVVVSL